eukprot:s482_g24.t1
MRYFSRIIAVVFVSTGFIWICHFIWDNSEDLTLTVHIHGELLNGLPGRRGYCLRLGIDAMKNGVWRLESGGQSARLLARGRLFSPLGTWHRLRLAANGTVIRASWMNSTAIFGHISGTRDVIRYLK